MSYNPRLAVTDSSASYVSIYGHTYIERDVYIIYMLCTAEFEAVSVCDMHVRWVGGQHMITHAILDQIKERNFPPRCFNYY